MLSHIKIKNFAIIEEEEIYFEPGFTALTGETGAGKSIILDAMGLILGARASVDMVRRGELKAVIVATFKVGAQEQELIDARCTERGITPCHKSTLTIKRVVSVSGRNIAQVNKTRVSTSTLRSVTEGLIEIVRQHESYTLLDPEEHLNLLDAFGDHQDETLLLREEVERWRSLEAEQRRLKGTQAERESKIMSLQSRIDHIERVGPELNEDEHIERDLRLLHAAEQLSSWVDKGINTLYDDQHAVLNRLERMNASLEGLVHVDERLENFYEAIERAHLELDELTHDLRRFRSEIPHDHSTLIELETRRAQLEQLKAEYGMTLGEILEQAEHLKRERDELEQLNLRVKATEIEAKAALAAADLRAQTLAVLRKGLGQLLSDKIESELQHLGMAQCRFKVQFDECKLNERGKDRIEFLISPNPGEGFKPLARIASGGELSRLTLALKVVLMHSDHTPTYLFDEIDSGIGGAVAEGVGIKLKRISSSRQVICITHLPQVASNAHRHLKIAKVLLSDRTFSSISALSDQERIHEVARMLGGQDLTETTLAHAQEMVSRGRL